jgi:ribose transport system permease protein
MTLPEGVDVSPAPTGSEVVEEEGGQSRLRTVMKSINAPDLAILLSLVVLFIVLSIASSAFLTKANLLNLMSQWSPVCFMALGGTLVLIAGGFDLSIGAIFAMSGIMAVKITNATGAPAGLIGGLLVGLGLGLANGFLVSVLRMNVFVATIGMSIVLSGLALVITGGSVITTTNLSFQVFGTTEFLGVSLDIWLMILAIIICSQVLNRLTLGRYIRAVGGSIEAARLSGVRTEWIRAASFMASGLGGGIAGVIVASRSISANANAFSGSQYAVWTALLIGGNSMYGGQGAVWRTVVGVALLALIGNGFDLLNVDPLYQQIVTGGILLTAVAIDMHIRRRRLS